MFLIIYYYLTISYYIENKYIFDIEIEKHYKIYKKQKEFFNSRKTYPISFRINSLKRLKQISLNMKMKFVKP